MRPVPGRLSAPLTAPAPDARSAPRGPSARAGSTRSVAGSRVPHRVRSRRGRDSHRRRPPPGEPGRGVRGRPRRARRVRRPHRRRLDRGSRSLGGRGGSRPLDRLGTRPRQDRRPRPRCRVALVRHEADRAAGAHPPAPEPDQRRGIDPHLPRVSRRTRSWSARSRSQSPRRGGHPHPVPCDRTRADHVRRLANGAVPNANHAQSPRQGRPGAAGDKSRCAKGSNVSGALRQLLLAARSGRAHADPIRDRSGRDPGAHAESDRPHVAPASADMREERRRRRVTCRARTSRHLVGRRWAGSHWRPLACQTRRLSLDPLICGPFRPREW